MWCYLCHEWLRTASHCQRSQQRLHLHSHSGADRILVPIVALLTCFTLNVSLFQYHVAHPVKFQILILRATSDWIYPRSWKRGATNLLLVQFIAQSMTMNELVVALVAV